MCKQTIYLGTAEGFRVFLRDSCWVLSVIIKHFTFFFTVYGALLLLKTRDLNPCRFFATQTAYLHFHTKKKKREVDCSPSKFFIIDNNDRTQRTKNVFFNQIYTFPREIKYLRSPSDCLQQRPALDKYFCPIN